MRQLLFPNNPQFWYETLRSMSHIAYGGADFGEVVSTERAHRRGRLRQLAHRVARHRRPGVRRG